MIRAIFFDIDGTLVSFKTHQVPASAAEAIKKYQAKGVKMFICSGRPTVLLPDFSLPAFGNLHFDGMVVQNGGCCLDGDGNIIYQKYIDRRDFQHLLQYLNEVESFPVSVMTQSGVFINYVDERVMYLANVINTPIPAVRPLEEVDDDILMINVYGEKGLEDRLVKKVLTHCEASRWHPYFADINVKGNSKRTGIDVMLDHFGVSLADTMAFGDGGNDISMLEHVAVGVAMGNAEDASVFAAAPYRTGTVEEDGIASFLTQYLGIPIY